MNLQLLTFFGCFFHLSEAEDEEVGDRLVLLIRHTDLPNWFIRFDRFLLSVLLLSVLQWRLIFTVHSILHGLFNVTWGVREGGREGGMDGVREGVREGGTDL